MNPAQMNLMSKLAAPRLVHCIKSCNSKYTPFLKTFHCREPDGQASGGDDTGSDDWIFNTIREKDLKKCQNGTAQLEELDRKQVKPFIDEFYMSLRFPFSPLNHPPLFPGAGESKEAFVTKLIFNLFSIVY